MRKNPIDGNLIGLTNLQEEEAEIFVGIGVAPAYVSQGWGRRILLAGTLALARQARPPHFAGTAK